MPHRGPSLMIRRILETSGNELRCVGRIPTGSPFAAGGTAPCFVGLDLLAQAAAALEALQRAASSAGGPGIGYVVGIREARFETSTLPLGSDLVAHVRLLDGTVSLAHQEVRLAEGDTSCLSAVLTTFRVAPVDIR